MQDGVRCFSIVVLLLALMGSGSAAEPPDPAEKEAIAAIEKLGGSVIRHEGHVFYVELSDTQFKDSGLAHLKGLTKLVCLHLKSTEVSDAGLVHLKGLTKLHYLHLDNTNVTDAGLVHLKGLADLRTLDLRDTNVTEEGVKGLQTALPKCEILRK